MNKRVLAVSVLVSLLVMACSKRAPELEGASPSETTGVLPSGFSEATFRAPQASLHYVHGGAGPAILLLHGFPEDWSAWRKVAPLLADKFTLIAPDLPGIGASTNTSGSFDPATMAEFIPPLLTQLDIRKVYVVGHDIGGPVAYALARLHPDLVSGVMLVESPLEGMPTWAAARNSPLMWHLGFHQTPELPEQLLAGREALYVRHFLKLSSGGATPDERDVERFAAAYRGSSRLGALLAIYRQLDAQESFNLAHREPTDIPIRFVGGERVFGALADGIVNDLRAWNWANAEGRVVPDAGHYIADEQPDALAKLIAAHATH